MCAIMSLSILFLWNRVFADSPLTSTEFYTQYQEYDIVKYAHEKGIMDDKIADYLVSSKNLIDVKAAVINALGWSYEGKSNALEFKKHLAKKYSITSENLNVNSLTGSELMCLGYLSAMDNYFDVTQAIDYLEISKSKMPLSFTVHMIYAIIKGQQVFDNNWCEIWTVTKNVLNDHSLARDLKTSAAQIIVDYMLQYKSSCYEQLEY